MDGWMDGFLLNCGKYTVYSLKQLCRTRHIINTHLYLQNY